MSQDRLPFRQWRVPGWESNRIGCKVIYDSRPSHIWGKTCAFPHILGSPSSYMTLHPIPLWISLYMRTILFLFYQPAWPAGGGRGVSLCGRVEAVLASRLFQNWSLLLLPLLPEVRYFWGWSCWPAEIAVEKLSWNFLIEDFFIYHQLMLTTPVVHLELRISPRIFELIRNGPNGKFRGNWFIQKIFFFFSYILVILIIF